jgi:hypothetical protein
MKETRTIQLTLRSAGGQSVPEIVRLRLLIKRLLRQGGFRLVSIEGLPVDEPAAARRDREAE